MSEAEHGLHLRMGTGLVVPRSWAQDRPDSAGFYAVLGFGPVGRPPSPLVSPRIRFNPIFISREKKMGKN